MNRRLPEEPVDADGFHKRGNRYSRNGSYEQAIRDYNQAIALNPKYVEAYANKGSVYYSQGKYQKAIQNWEKAIFLGVPRQTLLPRINKAKRHIK